MTDRVDHIRGALLGLTIGDALGAPFEGRAPQTIRERYPSATRLLHDPPGPTLHYTDDTQMAVAVAETLVEARSPSVEAFASSYVSNYESWRGYGGGARKVIAALQSGATPHEAARIAFPTGSYANGAAMRVAPVGLRFAHDPEALHVHTIRSAQPTHCHPLGVEGALVMARATSWALRHLTRPFARPAFWDAVEHGLTEPAFVQRLQQARQATSLEQVAALGNGIAAVDSVVTALALFALTPDDFVATVGEAVLLGGDCDTIAAMAGALSGARLSVNALPSAWLDRLEDGKKGASYIDKLATSLSGAWADEVA